MRIWIAGVTVIGAAITMVGALGYWRMGTPEYSLHRIRQAHKNHDYQEFIKHFDVEAIAERAGEEFVRSLERPREAPEKDASVCREAPPTYDEKVYWKTRVQKETSEWYRSAFDKSLLYSDSEWFGDFSTGRVQITDGGVLVLIESKGSRAKLRMIRIPGRKWKVVEITEWEWQPEVMTWH